MTQIAREIRLAPLPALRPGRHRLAWQSGAAVALLVIYAVVVRFAATQSGVRSNMPPIYSWRRLPSIKHVTDAIRLLIPVGLFLGWRALATSRRWQRLPDLAIVAALVGTVFVLNIAVAASTGGLKAIVDPFDYPRIEFFSDVHFVAGFRQFLHDCVALHPALSLHGRTHPPGPTLFLYAVQKFIGPGLVRAAFAAIAVTSLTIVPVFLLVRRLYGRPIALITAALYVVAPSLVLFGATSMDGVYTLPLLLSLYTFFRAVEAKTPRASVAWSVTAGLLIALSTLMTFSTVCLILILSLYGGIAFFGLRPWKRIWAVLLVSGAACLAAYALLYVGTGYNLIACLKVSMGSDENAMGPRRRAFLPYLDVSLANFMAFVVGSGVVASVLWAKQIKATLINLSNRQAVDPLLLAFAAAVPLLALSTMYRWETERIWMFLTPLVLVAAAKQIAHAPGGTRRVFDFCLCGLFAQTFLMQTFLFTVW